MRRKPHLLKDPIQERHLFRTRAIVAGVVAVLLLLLLAMRMAFLQVTSHSHFTTLSHNNRVSIQPIAPIRGLIFDRNGVVLAENLPAFSLEIVPERVDDMDATLAAVSTLIEVSQDDRDRFREELKRRRRFEEIPLRFRLTDEEVAAVAVNRHRLPGVEIKSRLARHYPMGPLTSHVVGYVGRISEDELNAIDASNYSATNHIGKVGVERSYEEVLHGTVGYQQVETNARGRILRVLERTLPTPGKNLWLNIDVHAQRAAAEAFGEERGALVAVDPRDGGVVALVSMPGFDPNAFVNGISTKEYRALMNDPDQPLFNRALRGRYPPGSTTKPFVGLAGLESGTIRPEDRIFCPGWYQLKGDDHRYRDWKKHGHGWTDLNKGVVESCDVFFYDLAHKLGIDALSDYLMRFGFGEVTGIDIIGESRGLMPSREWKRRALQQAWYPGETLIAGIGQGFVLATPLQLAANTATLASHGRGLEPRVVREIEDPLESVRTPVVATAREPLPVHSEENWQHIIDAMIEVVHGVRGTARRIAAGITYQVAGKTGTAQVVGIAQDAKYVEEELEKRLRDHALFLGFAPADRPQLAVSVIVENGGSGGAVASPVARRVMDAYILGNREAITHE